MKTFTIARDCRRRRGDRGRPRRPGACSTASRKKHNVTFAFQDFDWGAEHYFRWGRMMPAGAIDLLQPCDAILLGAVGHPDIPDHTTLNGLLLPIRRAFDQYANVRPAYLYPGVRSPLARPRAATSISWWCARTPRANTRRWADSSTTSSRKKSPSRPPSSPAAASSASCASPSNWRVKREQEEARHFHHQVQRAGLQHGAVGPHVPGRGGAVPRISKPNRCWWTPPP